jgi:hypothetical protein
MKVFAFYFISECLDLINMTLPDLPSDFRCRILDTCTTVDCCVHVNFLQRNNCNIFTHKECRGQITTK